MIPLLVRRTENPSSGAPVLFLKEATDAVYILD